MATNMNSASSRPANVSVPVRTITNRDVNAALREGLDDFLEMRGDLLFIGLLYPLVAIVAGTAIAGGRMLPLLLPILAGIGLLGPVAAIGFYELARRREDGLHSNWSHFLDVRKRPSSEDIGAVAALLLAIFGAWLLAAGGLYVALWGWTAPESLGAFITDVFTTGRGWAMIVVGGVIGAIFAVLVLAISVVSLPMLVDCDIKASEAVATSVRAARANKGPVLRWGVIVAALLVLGSIPLFLGLAVVLPWLGYATWHLYTKLVDRSAIAARCD